MFNDFFDNTSTKTDTEYAKIAVGGHLAKLDNVELDTTNNDRIKIKITWVFANSKRKAWQDLPFTEKTKKLAAWQLREFGIMDELKTKVSDNPTAIELATKSYSLLSNKLNQEFTIDVSYREYTAKDGSKKEAMSVIVKSGADLAPTLLETTPTKDTSFFNESESVPF